MATDLYEILHVPRDASMEDIRKAYKKRALQTHPDRNLSHNATPSEKAAIEEQFRKVNNAYEILKDERKRQAYDLHGVWPPPREEVRPPTASYYDDQPRYRPRSRHHSYSPHFHEFPDFHFTDPFVFFDSIFNTGHNSRRGYHHPHAAFDNNIHSEMDNLMSNIFSASTAFSNVGFGMGGMGMGMGMGMGLTPMNRHRRTFSTSMNMGSVSRGGGGGNWASESTMSQTINGVTQTIKKRRDWDGNEYVTRTYPDGRKVVTINGVVQSESDQGHIPPPTNRNYLPPSGSPPPPYSPRNYAESSERPVIPVTPNFSAANYNNDEGMPSHPKSSRKRWWDRT